MTVAGLTIVSATNWRYVRRSDVSLSRSRCGSPGAARAALEGADDAPPGDDHQHGHRQPAERDLDRRDELGEGRPEQGGERGVDEVGRGRAGARRPAVGAAAPDRRLDDQDRDRPERDGDPEAGRDPGREGRLQVRPRRAADAGDGDQRTTPRPKPARTSPIARRVASVS